MPTPTMRTRGARFQQWQALLTQRNKRHRLRSFLVHGVRPITVAVEQDWPLEAVLVRDGAPLSRWARDLLDGVRAEQVPLTEELMAELADREPGAPELVAVARIPPGGIDRIPDRAGLLLAFDRPSSPGNLGMLIRSADAFGADGVVVTGHGADVYDPRTVRASTGSLFSVPTVQVPGPSDVRAWADRRGARVVGTDEQGDTTLDRCDLTGPTVVVLGNETTGMSVAWREACDSTLTIPIGGTASSLNVAAAGSIVLYEAARQRAGQA